MQPELKLLRKLVSFEKELQESLWSAARKGQEKTVRVAHRGQTIEKGAVLRPRIQKKKYQQEKICSTKEIKQRSRRLQLSNAEDVLMLTHPYLSDSCLESKYALCAIVGLGSRVSV